MLHGRSPLKPLPCVSISCLAGEFFQDKHHNPSPLDSQGLAQSQTITGNSRSVMFSFCSVRNLPYWHLSSLGVEPLPSGSFAGPRTYSWPWVKAFGLSEQTGMMTEQINKWEEDGWVRRAGLLGPEKQALLTLFFPLALLLLTGLAL